MESKTVIVNAITVIHWNINGFRLRNQELQTYLDRNNVDVVCLNEPKCVAATIRLPGYDTLYHQRDDALHPRVAMLVKKGHWYTRLQVLTSIEAVIISFANGTTIAAAYLACGATFTPTDVHNIMEASHKTILVGDLNAKHPDWCRTPGNRNGNQLHAIVTNSNIVIEHTLEPTFPRSGSTLDIVLNKHSVIRHLATVDELESDHLPITFEIDCPGLKITTELYFNYAKSDWKVYKQKVNEFLTINEINTVQDIETALQHFMDVIRRATTESLPQTTRRHPKSILTTEMLALLREKRQMRRRYQRSRDPSDWTRTLHLAAQFRQCLGDKRKADYHAQLEKANLQDGSLWRVLRGCKSRSSAPTALAVHNATITDEKLICDQLAAQFSTAHELPACVDHHIEATVNRTYHQVITADVPVTNRLTTDKYEVTRLIQRLKLRTAPGADAIYNIQLKHLPRKGIAALTTIYKACLHLHYIPACWKLATIVPILKAGKPKKEASSYRPISLLPTLSKIFEKIIASRMDHHLKQNDVMMQEQYGFRSKHSTVHQLYRLTNEIRHNYNIGKLTGLLCLDMKQAFDKVWHAGLIYKLRQCGLPISIVKIVAVYLQDRRFAVRVGQSISDTAAIPAGVPQGSVLGPKLYTLYINDLHQHPDTNIALFADDTALYASSLSVALVEKRLQEHLNSLTPYFDKWRLILNTDKTQLCVFTMKRKVPPIQLRINAATITPQDTVEYLGVILDKRLTFGQHISRLRKKANAAIGQYYRLLIRTSPININTKKLIYTTTIKPVMTYAAPIWSTAANSHLDLLERAQLKALKIIGGHPRHEATTRVLKQFQLPSMKTTIKDHTWNFFYKSKGRTPLTRDIPLFTLTSNPYCKKYKLANHTLLR